MRKTASLHAIVVASVLSILRVSAAPASADPNEQIRQSVLEQDELYPLTLYGVHANDTLRQRPLDAALYLYFSARLRGLGSNYADNGVFKLSRVPDFEWQSLARTMGEAQTWMASRYNENPSTTAGELLTTAVPGVLATAGTYVSPWLGLAVGIGSSTGLNSVADEYQTNRTAQSIVTGETYLTSLDVPSSLFVESTFVQMTCTDSTMCIRVHDTFFKDTMNGVSLQATPEQRLANATDLRQDRTLALLQKHKHDRELGQAQSAQSPPAAAGESAMDETQGETSSAGSTTPFARYWSDSIMQMWTDVTTPEIPTTAEDIQASTDLLVAYGTLTGHHREAQAAAVVGASIAKFADAAEKFEKLNLQTGAAALGVLSGVMTASALLSSGGKSADEMILEALAVLSQQVANLHETVVEGFYTSQANMAIYHNRAEYGIEEVLSGIDLVQRNLYAVGRSVRLQRAEALHLVVARQRLELAAALERCGILPERPLPLSRRQSCEDDMFRGSAFGSMYAFHERDGLASVTGIPTDSLRFHESYGALLRTVGERVATELRDPYYWEQYALGLLALYVRNPAVATEDLVERSSRLQYLADVGRTIRSDLLTIYSADTPSTREIKDSGLVAGLAADYFQKLTALAAIAAQQAPSGEFGESPIQDIHTLPTDRRRRTALEYRINGSESTIPVLAACHESGDAAFAASPAAVSSQWPTLAHGDASTWVPGWDRQTVNTARINAPGYLSIVPAPVIWAHVEGLGHIDVCLAEYRPTAVQFTRKSYSDWVKAADANIRTRIRVSFLPTNETAKLLRVAAGTAVPIAEVGGEVACTGIGYRLERAGYPGERRMHGVFSQMLREWDEASRCNVAVRDGIRNLRTEDEAVRSIAKLVSERRAQSRQPLAEKLITSGAFDAANDSYLALALTLDLTIPSFMLEQHDSVSLTTPIQFVNELLEQSSDTGKEYEWLKRQQRRNNSGREVLLTWHQSKALPLVLKARAAGMPNALDRIDADVEKLNVGASAYSAAAAMESPTVEYVGIASAAEVLRISEKRMARLLEQGSVVGARQILGEWSIPVPVMVIESPDAEADVRGRR